MRLRLIGVVLLAAIMGLVVGCRDSGSQTKEIRIGFQTIPNTEAVAKGEGWHEQNLSGWKVKWVPFESGRDVNNALASASIDIGLVGSTLVATGLSKGIDYQVIWLADVIGENEALVVKESSGIHEIGDLVGKTIAVTFGSTTQYSLLGALQASQIDPSKVHIVDMKPVDMLAAWNRGDIDGGYVWQPTLQQMQQDGGHVLITSGQLAQKGIVTADVIVVRRSFAESHPEQIKAYLTNLNKAVALYREQPDEAATVVAKEFGISNKEAADMMKELIWLSGEEQLSADYLGSPDKPGNFEKVLDDTARFLKEQNLIDQVPSQKVFQDAISNRLLQDAVHGVKEKS